MNSRSNNKRSPAGRVALLALMGCVSLAGHGKQPSRAEEIRRDSQTPSTDRASTIIVDLTEELRDLIAQAERDFPESAEPKVLRGMLCRQLGDHRQSLKLWREFLVKMPQRPDVLNHLALTSLEMEAYEEAIQYWRRAVAVAPKLPGLRQHMGFALMESGRPYEAIMALHQELTLSPHAGPAWTLLGQCCLQVEEYALAESAFERALAIDPKDANALYGLMTVSQRLKQSERARHYMTRFRALSEGGDHLVRGGYRPGQDLLQMQSGAVPLLLESGALYRDQGRPEKANALLRRALQLDREKTIGYLKRQVLYQQSLGAPDRALASMTQVMALEPNEPDNLLGLGMLSLQAGEQEGAKRAFTRLIELAPHQADGYRELARMHLRRREKSIVALALAQKAVHLEETAEHYHLLGIAYLNNGQVPDALAALQKAVERDPEHPGYRRTLDALRSQTSR